MHPVPPPTIAAPEIAELYGCAVNTVYRLHLRRPSFPAPRCLGRRRLWDRAAVMADFADFMGWVTPEHQPVVLPAAASIALLATTTVRNRRRRSTPAPRGPRGPRW